MEIVNISNGKYNFQEELRPLFEAMVAGRKIKSVTCMRGTINKSNPSADFKIEDFVALTYRVGVSDSKDNSWDYVETDYSVKFKNFYMDWVRSFELY